MSKPVSEKTGCLIAIALVLSIFIASSIVGGIINGITYALESIPWYVYIILIIIIIAIYYSMSNPKAYKNNVSIGVEKWNNFLTEESEDETLNALYYNFFAVDNIDFDKFFSNLKAESIISEFGSIERYNDLNKLSVDYDGQELKISCTKTYETHFTNSYLRDIPIGFEYWFVVAYPDVIVWLKNNFKTIEKIVEENESDYFDENDRPMHSFFRLLIDKYKRLNKLECSF